MYLEANIGMALTWSIGLYGNYKFSPNSPVNIPLMPSKLTDSHSLCCKTAFCHSPFNFYRAYLHDLLQNMSLIVPFSVACQYFHASNILMNIADITYPSKGEWQHFFTHGYLFTLHACSDISWRQ